ncbi:hypothetical protein [Paenibacillus sp. LPE1-1-1.1]|uniref:hypothetical protein n=1 Tax=Paenibacillus sp. LPE1-1-1.1 TaxID=3135230 RepID=UPI0034386156
MGVRKRIGYGSLSLFLLLSGFLINWNFGNDLIVSHSLFKIVGLDIYSNGTDGFHYPFLASISFWLAAVLVSKRYVNDFGAVVSNRIGEFMLAISVIVTTIFLILPIWIKF